MCDPRFRRHAPRRTRRIATALLAAAVGSAPLSAIAQTSSWSSRVESGAGAQAAPPPGTTVLPKGGARPRIIDSPPAHQNIRPSAPLPARPDGKASKLKQGTPPANAPNPVKAPTGDNAAYIAFDNGLFLTALKLAEQAAAKGEPEAHTLIARIHGEGHGVPRDLALAAKWYLRAAELGDPEAAFALGLMFVTGQSVKKDNISAAGWLEKSAATGHVYANYNLGLMFLSGLGKPENPIRGAQHLTYAAEKGVPAAQYDLATLYISGHGVPTDGYLASRWLKRAAEQGMAEAQFDYAIMLFKGQGLNEDRPDAFRYLKSAAEQGNPAAQNRLAHLLVEGTATAANPREAAKWRLLAKDQGLLDDKLDGIVRRMPAAERTAAELLAGQWRERALVGAAAE